jgi:hypothetical protein
LIIPFQEGDAEAKDSDVELAREIIQLSENGRAELDFRFFFLGFFFSLRRLRRSFKFGGFAYRR